MNIMFRGGGFSNKGDEAMMLTVRAELARRLPPANFILWSDPASLEKAYADGFLGYTRSDGLIRRGVHLIHSWVVDRNVRRATRIDSIVAEAIAGVGPFDCVVDFSGFNYSDEWGVLHAKRGLAWADYCNRTNKPFVCLPQAWGPFQTRSVAEATRRLCECSSLVYARDETSLVFLEELLGKGNRDVRTAPDIAFMFSGERPEAGRQALMSLGVDVGKSPVVGIAPNMRVYERCQGTGAANGYVQMLVGIAEHCIQAWDAAVVLLPHEFSLRKTIRKDDRFLCGLVRTRVSNADRCHTVKTYVSASLIKAMESQLDFMIGSRYHSCVFALSSGVPAVALGWSHKYLELMDLVGLTGSAVVHTQFDEKSVIQMLDRAWGRRIESKSVIQEHLPEIQQKIEMLFDAVSAVLGQHKSPPR